MDATATMPTKSQAKPAALDIDPLLDRDCPSPKGSTRRVHLLWDRHFRINWHLDGKVVESAFVSQVGDGELRIVRG